MHLIKHTHALRRSGFRDCLVLLGLAAMICLAACSSNSLTRPHVAEMINSSEEFKQPVAVTLLPEYRQSLTLIGSGSHTTSKPDFALQRFLESHAELAVLNHLGLVDFKVSSIEYPDSASSPVVVTSSLTEKGRAASRQWQQSGNGWAIPIAKKEVVEVTGLTGSEGDSKTARAEYMWRWQPTEVGKSFDKSDSAYQNVPASIRSNLGGASMADMMRQLGNGVVFDSSQTQKASASFRLYDDGWHLLKEDK
jgi:hypothetical protein